MLMPLPTFSASQLAIVASVERTLSITPFSRASLVTSIVGGKPRIKQSAEIEKALIDKFRKQKELSKQSDSGQKKEVQLYVVVSVKYATTRTQKDIIDKGKCVNKLDALKKLQKAQIDIYNNSSQTIDEQGLLVSLKEVIDAYFNAYPYARQFYEAPLNYEEDLNFLFSSVTATGLIAYNVLELNNPSSS